MWVPRMSSIELERRSCRSDLLVMTVGDGLALRVSRPSSQSVGRRHPRGLVGQAPVRAISHAFGELARSCASVDKPTGRGQLNSAVMRAAA